MPYGVENMVSKHYFIVWIPPAQNNPEKVKIKKRFHIELLEDLFYQIAVPSHAKNVTRIILVALRGLNSGKFLTLLLNKTLKSTILTNVFQRKNNYLSTNGMKITI